MSTRNVAERAAAARQALADLDAAVQQRVREAREDQHRLQRERERMLRASGVALQAIADEHGELSEELQQLDPHNAPVPLVRQPPASADGGDQPQAGRGRRAMDRVRRAAQAQPDDGDDQEDDDVVPGLTPPPAPAPRRAPQRNPLNPGEWCKWAFWAAVIAALFAVLGLWLSCNFVVWSGHDLVKEIIANILIDGGIIGVCFFGVGFIANEICRKLHRGPQHG